MGAPAASLWSRRHCALVADWLSLLAYRRGSRYRQCARDAFVACSRNVFVQSVQEVVFDVDSCRIGCPVQDLVHSFLYLLFDLPETEVRRIFMCFFLPHGN